MKRLAWHAACMGRENIQGFGGGNMKGRGYLEDLELDKRVTLK